VFGYLLQETDQFTQQRKQVLAFVFEEREKLFVAHQFQLCECEFWVFIRVNFHQFLYDLPKDLLFDGENVAQLFYQTKLVENVQKQA